MGVKEVAKNSAAKHTESESAAVATVVKRSSRPENKNWEFSFKHFRQIDKFGLDGGGIANDWLVSLLERLKQLSQESIENILGNQIMADSYRYHPINWGANSIPIERNTLDWISEPYKSNPEEYPIDQIMVSMGTGRIVGFFDENWVFHLVLLDPLHNLQPSKRFNYTVNPSSPLNCQLTQLQVAVRDGLQHCSGHECGASARIRDALDEKTYSERYGIVLLKIEDSQTLNDAQALIAEKGADSYAEIFEAGLCYMIANPKPSA